MFVMNIKFLIYFDELRIFHPHKRLSCNVLEQEFSASQILQSNPDIICYQFVSANNPKIGQRHIY